ncbi:MAG: transketolase [Bacteriovorax sp.]
MKSTPKDLRKTILRMAYNAQSVHIGCSFSLVEIAHVLYSKFVDSKKLLSLASDRDYVCLSKGHGVMAIYANLFALGMIKEEEIEHYFSDGSSLTGLSDAHVPGIEVSGGSLGQGITVATGIALSKKIDNATSKIFCIVGDGELNEGSAWEAIMIAAHRQLNNFIVIVDANSFQAMGRCESVLNMESFRDKFEAFNFEALECDGHDTEALEKNLLILVNSQSSKPKALIARTTKGKGVSFMENDNIWHYTRLNPETYQKALSELK